VSWPEFAELPPLRPEPARPWATQRLVAAFWEGWLAAWHGFSGCLSFIASKSFGCQGEYAGLLVIPALAPQAAGEATRTIWLSSSHASAHGTNPAQRRDGWPQGVPAASMRRATSTWPPGAKAIIPRRNRWRR